MPTTRARSLAHVLTHSVDTPVRERGKRYHDAGVVRILAGDDLAVQALVQGTTEYDIELSYEALDQMLLGSCSCPYFRDQCDICKHIWATLLACDSEGYLSAALSADDLDLVVDFDRFEEPDEDEDSSDEDDRYDPPIPFMPRSVSQRSAVRRSTVREPNPKALWRRQVDSLRYAMQPKTSGDASQWSADRQILYVIDVQKALEGEGLTVEIAYRQPKMDGAWSKPKSQAVDEGIISQLSDATDAQLLSLMLGPTPTSNRGWYNSYYRVSSTCYSLPQPLHETMLSMMCGTGRCMLRQDRSNELMPIRWDDGPAWELWLEVRPDEPSKGYAITGMLRRGEEQVPLAVPVLLVAGGIVFFEDRAARLDDAGAFAWISLLREQDRITVPAVEDAELLNTLLGLPRLPRLQLPESLQFERVQGRPRPRLRVNTPSRGRTHRLVGLLTFDYEGMIIDGNHAPPHVFQAEDCRLIVRDRGAEQAAAGQLRQLGFRDVPYYQRERADEMSLAPRHLSRVVDTLLGAGWHVEADGKQLRHPGQINIEVRSGIDWFELHGEAEFGDRSARLPELLKALHRGENTVLLDDGSFGMLPDQWLARYGMLAGIGQPQDDHVRFTSMQIGLLDALLAAMPEARCDEQFAKVRDRLRTFEGVKPVDPPNSFKGRLRGYQSDGLGWLQFLQQFGFGGCLADDMGLGKTVQVLALLERRRRQRAQSRKAKKAAPTPSLVVVPRSIVFNWKQEAARFTPKLRVLDHTGIDRVRGTDHFSQYDLVVTTYGTLRSDVVIFKNVQFDYVILDEAQAVKNANTASAKACRLLQGRYRLAMSGTPIENHLGDLWSLFEFLNPGMLGTASVFKQIGHGNNRGNGNGKNDTECHSADEPHGRELLAKALKPFILRRTKEQVAKELPKKLEQTLYCELPAKQRKLYDELRDHYRRSLLERVDRRGMNRSKIQVLEALLRLRQAACHPGLIDKSKVKEPAAKLDLLLPQLAEVLDEGHKALVFSQFTSFLAIVRKQLDCEGTVYEYLDGRTRKRGPKIERFQTDPDCKLFLISLKAGGLGLNLTAADYVFLLDPWWNPAIEAQAIDRVHRIGQTNQVFAYRLIARETVEEKVAELQQSKRELANAIITADNSLIRDLGRDDLELLLS